MILDKHEYDFYDGTNRPIYVLRPESFDSNKDYKTLYMFDGSSTFIGSEYTGESWGVIETFEELGIDDWIVVGIEHAGNNRIQEYLPYDFEHHGKVTQSRAKEFDKFIFEDVIPFIEEKYPVKSDSSARALAGSSMGGFITAAYAAKHKDKFSMYGVFSLASWMTHDKSFFRFLDQHGIDPTSKYFIYVGDKEGYHTESGFETEKVTRMYLHESKEYVDYLENHEVKQIKYLIGEGKNHSEVAWKEYFPQFIKFIS